MSNFYESNNNAKEFVENKLTEKTWDIDSTIETIFKYMKPYIEELKKLTIDSVAPFIRNSPFQSINTSTLRGDDVIRQADKEFPIDIVIGVFPQNSFSPDRGSIELHIVSRNLLNFFRSSGKANQTFEEFINSKPTFNANTSISQEITDIRFKQSIAHELTHWLDYALLYNYFKDVERFLTSGKNADLINLAQYEINAQINQIKQVYRSTPKEVWDRLTIVDVLKTAPSLISLYTYFKKSKNLKEWMRILLSRLAREDMVGKNMTKLGDDSVLYEFNTKLISKEAYYS